MSSPNHPILQQFPPIDRSSPDFHDQLDKLLCGQEYEQSVPDLQGDNLIWLVDYLDKVRSRVALPHSPLKPA